MILHSCIKHLKGTFRFLGKGFYVKQILESSAVSGSARASYTSDERVLVGGKSCGGGGYDPGPAGRRAGALRYDPSAVSGSQLPVLCFPEAFLVFPKNYISEVR